LATFEALTKKQTGHTLKPTSRLKSFTHTHTDTYTILWLAGSCVYIIVVLGILCILVAAK